MATSKGALTTALLGTSDSSTTEDMLTTLMGSPEQEWRDNNMAWGAGFGAPGDVGGALSRALGGELAQRNKTRDLKALYIPAVVQAITQQRQAEQIQGVLQAAMAGGQQPGQPGGGLANMSPETVAQLKALGVDISGLWEKAKFGEQRAPGSYSLLPSGETRHFPDLNTGVTMVGGQAQAIPNLAQIKANTAATQAYGEGLGAQPFKMVTGIDPKTGQPGTFRQSDVPMGGATRPPVPFPQQGATGGGGAGPAPAQRPSVAPNTSSPGRPVVSPQEQSQRDGDALTILQGELAKAVDAAQNNPDAAMRERAAQDAEAITREIQRLSGGRQTTPAAGAGSKGPSQPAAPGGVPPSFIPTDRTPEQKIVSENLATSAKNFLDKTLPEVEAQGSAANDIISNVNTFRTSLARLGPNSTGWGTEGFKKPVAEMLGALGVKNAAEAATSYQMFERALNDNMWSILNTAKGPQTDRDAERAKLTQSSLGKTPEANKFILDLTQASAERNKARAAFYRDARARMQEAGEADLSRIDGAWNSLPPKITSVWENPIMAKWKKHTEDKK